MRKLKLWRMKQRITQQEVAKRTGVSLSTYNLIENGARRGSHEFWLRLQREFNLTDGDVWKFQQNL